MKNYELLSIIKPNFDAEEVDKIIAQLEEYVSNLGGKVLENDKIGRKLDAMMITADESTLLLISGTGEVIEPDEGVCAIGSGGNYALAAARALYAETNYGAEEIAKKALKIASEICVFTNGNIRCETVGNTVNSTLPPAKEVKPRAKRVKKED